MCYNGTKIRKEKMGYFGFLRNEKRKERLFGDWAYEMYTGINVAVFMKYDSGNKSSNVLKNNTLKNHTILMTLEKYQTNFVLNFYSNIDKHMPELKKHIKEKVESNKKSFFRNASISVTAYIISLFCAAFLIRTKKDITSKNLKALIANLDLNNQERDKMFDEVMFSYKLQKLGLEGGTSQVLPWEILISTLCGFDLFETKKTEKDFLLEFNTRNMFSDGIGRFTIETTESIIKEDEDYRNKNLGSFFDLN